MSDRRTAVAVGALFLVATASFLAADGLVRTALERPDPLIAAAADGAPLRTAGLLALACGISGVAIALLVYPIFARHSVRLTLGYVALRVGELGPILLYLAAPLLLVTLGERAAGGGLDPAAASGLGALLQALHAVSLRVLFLFTGMSGTVFAYLLYRTRVVPRPIAVLGLIGYPLLVVGAVLYVFQRIDFLQGVGLLFAWVVGLFELILPIWLIVRGFRPEPGGTPAP